MQHETYDMQAPVLWVHHVSYCPVKPSLSVRVNVLHLFCYTNSPKPSNACH